MYTGKSNHKRRQIIEIKNVSFSHLTASHAFISTAAHNSTVLLFLLLLMVLRLDNLISKRFGQCSYVAFHTKQLIKFNSIIWRYANNKSVCIRASFRRIGCAHLLTISVGFEIVLFHPGEWFFF